MNKDDSCTLTARNLKENKTGRKTSDRGILKTKNSKQRIEKWKERIAGLLGKPLNITDEQVQTVRQRTLHNNTHNFTKRRTSKLCQIVEKRQSIRT